MFCLLYSAHYFSINHQSRENKDIFHHTFPIFVHRNVGDKFCIRACVARACLSKSRRVTNLIVSVWLVFCLVCFSVVSRIGCVKSICKESTPMHYWPQFCEFYIPSTVVFRFKHFRFRQDFTLPKMKE